MPCVLATSLNSALSNIRREEEAGEPPLHHLPCYTPSTTLQCSNTVKRLNTHHLNPTLTASDLPLRLTASSSPALSPLLSPTALSSLFELDLEEFGAELIAVEALNGGLR